MVRNINGPAVLFVVGAVFLGVHAAAWSFETASDDSCLVCQHDDGSADDSPSEKKSSRKGVTRHFTEHPTDDSYLESQGR